MKIIDYRLLGTIFCTVLACSCSNDSSSSDQSKISTPQSAIKSIAVKTPVFNYDSAYSYVKAQIDFGPRVPGSKSHAACADWMANKLKSFGWEITVQSDMVTMHDGKKFQLKNIIASWKPELGDRVLLVAHWDTRPWADSDTENTGKPADGADDGASGAGVLIELARQLKSNPIQQGLDILLNDLEDYGVNGSGSSEGTWCVGTQYWAKNPHKPNYLAKYGILLDMVGGKGMSFLQEDYSMYYASSIVKKVWDKAAYLGYSDYFIYEEGGRVTDDHVYINTLAKIPTIDIIGVERSSARFGEHHHTHADNMSVIDKNTLKAVGQTLLEVIYSEAP